MTANAKLAVSNTDPRISTHAAPPPLLSNMEKAVHLPPPPDCALRRIYDDLRRTAQAGGPSALAACRLPYVSVSGVQQSYAAAYFEEFKAAWHTTLEGVKVTYRITAATIGEWLGLCVSV